MNHFEMFSAKKIMMILITTFVLTETVNRTHISLTDSSGPDMQILCIADMSYLNYMGLNM